MKRFAALLIAAICALCLVACAPSNCEKAKAKMEKAGYTVLDYTVPKDQQEAGAVGGFVAQKGLIGGENVTAVLYSSAKEAKEAAGDKLTVVGKWVIIVSTEQGLKDFK